MSDSILSASDPFDEPTMRTMRGGDAAALGRIDQYELLRKLGGGGFGVVYLARDTVSGVEVALKTLHPLLKRNPEEMENLREKFALVSRLSHPGIASPLVLLQIRDIHVWDETARAELRLSPGDSVMVMRYAPGITLSRWRKQFPGGVVPLAQALEIGRQVAAALDYAHSERIVHRDVKPGNVMIETIAAGGASRPGEPQRLRARVLDFGLASEIRSSMSRLSTEPGDTSGTRPYMAPEQWAGRRQDGRTDQYALAAMLYELLCGAPPFAGVFETGDPMIMMATVKSETPEDVPDAPAAVNAALLRALAKDPAARFPTCTAFVEALAGDGGANRQSEPPLQRRAAEPQSGAEGGASRPGEPQSPAARLGSDASPHPARSESSPPSGSRLGSDASPRLPAATPSDDLPFALEWDEARAFIAGQPGAFAFRLRALVALAHVGLAVRLSGVAEPLVVKRAGLRAGETCEETLAFTPAVAGSLSVRLQLETILESGTHETYEARRTFEHVVRSATHEEVQGPGSVTVNFVPTVENNTGIVRMEDARLSVAGLQSVRVDRWADQDRVIGRRGAYRPVFFASVSVSHENVRLRAAGADPGELLVLPGSDCVTFGASRRAAVRLEPETAAGAPDPLRRRYVSGLHFAIRRDPSRDAFFLYDGGPDRDPPHAWRPSTNGLTIDGAALAAPRPLPLDRPAEIRLAPFAANGGALALSIEARGWDDPAAAGRRRTGDLSSALLRRRDNPGKAILVVWGAAALDPVLGTNAGLRVAAEGGRLFLVRPDGRAERFGRLAGRTLPGTPYLVQ